MDKKEKSYFWNLVRATRIKRTLPILMIILIPAAYSNKFPLTVLLLFLVVILIYSASSIYNAYKDGDYKLPNYYFVIILILLFLTLVISLLDKIIFFAALIAIFLGYIYNTVARFIPLGDALTAGLTHFVLPIIVSSLLVGLGLSFIIPCAIFVYLIAICIGPVTNLKDIKEDKKRGYKTLVNSVKNPKTVAITLFSFSFIIIFLLYLFLGIRNLNLLFLIPSFLLIIMTTRQIYKGKMKSALNLMRFYLITSFGILIFILTSNVNVILGSAFIVMIYFFTLIQRGFYGKI